MSPFKLLALPLAFGFAAAAPTAHAAIIAYTNLASFQAAAGATSLETFSGATVGTSTANYGPTAFNGFTLSSVANGDRSGIATGTIANAGDDTSIPASFAGQNFYGWGNVDGNVGPTTTFAFGRPVTAFGFDWFNTDTTDGYNVTVNALTTLVFNPTRSGFFGVVATGGETFNSATISNAFNGGYVSTEGLDNVRVSAAATAIPEPASLALVASALGGLGLVRRRRT